MRKVNVNVLSAADNQNTNGSQIDSNQLISASFHIYFGDATAAGTFKLQASNDIYQDQYQAGNFAATNWVDIPNESANITAGGSAILTVAQMAYRWVRAVYTSTAAGVQTVATVADVAGSLNSKYFLLNSGGTSPNRYYVWINVNSAGIDPAVAGRTGIEIAVSTGASASAVGTAIATAVAAVNSSNDFTTSGTTTVTITNKVTGAFTPMSDGTAATHFTFAVTGGGTTTVNVNMFGLSV